MSNFSVDGELTVEDKYKKTVEEIEALKDQLGKIFAKKTATNNVNFDCSPKKISFLQLNLPKSKSSSIFKIICRSLTINFFLIFSHQKGNNS